MTFGKVAAARTLTDSIHLNALSETLPCLTDIEEIKFNMP